MIDPWAVLLTLVAVMITVMAVVGVLIGLGAWSLAKHSRLAPDLETGAPMSWLWSPSQAARLHRRLQAAIVPVHQPEPRRDRRARAQRGSHRYQPTGHVSSLDDVCRTITGQAVAVDRELAIASRYPRRVRRVELRRLGRDVGEIERLAARVRRQKAEQAQFVSVDGSPPPTRAAHLAQAHAHLDALASAHAELRAIEQSNGLDDPDAILSGIDRRPDPVELTGDRSSTPATEHAPAPATESGPAPAPRWAPASSAPRPATSPTPNRAAPPRPPRD